MKDRRIHSAGHAIYYTDLYHSEHVHTVKVIIPHASDFFGVIKGIFVEAEVRQLFQNEAS